MKNLKKLTILHSNDMHGDFLAEQIDERLVGGVSLLSGYVNKVRREEKNVIYAVAGDMFRGSVIDSEYKGTSTIGIMNLVGPDVATIGNHEIDYGLAHLLFLEKCADFPIINANLHIKSNGRRMFRPFWIAHIDDMKILFIGIITEEVLAATKTDELIGSFVDIGEAAREVGNICNAYNAIDIDFTVLLTHIGFEEDKKLAAMLDPDWGVDVIIGGHSHTKLEEPFKVNDIYIVQAGTGTQLERMIRHILRDEAFQGEHTEFYQFSHGTHIVWSRSEQTFRTLRLDGEALYDERLYTVAVQKYHYNNLKPFLDITLEEVEKNGKIRVLSTSARDVVEEYLTVNQHLSREVEGRLVVED